VLAEPHLASGELALEKHDYALAAEAFREAAQMAEEFDTGIHTHSSETIWEVQESLKRFGRRPIEEFYNRGILGPRTLVAHCVWLDDREIQVLAQTGTSVAHCPCSNMKLSSGPARVIEMRLSELSGQPLVDLRLSGGQREVSSALSDFQALEGVRAIASGAVARLHE
jgi:cytosine/adenosine deaminase-related metal-dependent hydrolase